MPEDAAGERHVTAGPRARAAVERWLGLDRAHRGWRLDGLCALGEEVRLDLRRGTERRTFTMGPRSRIGRRGFAEVLEAIAQDPRSFAETVTGHGDRVRVPCVGQSIGLLEAGWRNFFADQDFEVLLGVPECVPTRTVNIEYADLECHSARPQRSFRKWSFLDWPEEGRDQTPDADARKFSVTSELEERDMVLGTGERADALAEEVRRLAVAGHHLVFTHLCTPIVMGEDLQGFARRCEKEVGGKAVRWSQKDRDDRDNFGEYFRSLLARPGFFDVPEDPLAVNLFHFPKGCREELRPLLEAIRLKVNLCVFPEVEFPSLEALPRARWQVFCQRSSYPTKVRELLARSPRPVLTVPAPYGVAGTRECLRAVAAAAGREQEFAAAWEERLLAFRPSWESMRKETAGCRLAFVVSEATLPRLLELRYGHGAPLAVMAREMGFGIDLLYYDLHGEEPELPEGLRGARVATFRTPWELERALRDGGFQAVYSDICFDWRISRAGKARFSSRDFEMGLEGARRNCERLLDACRLSFFRRYAAHLARGRHD